MPEPDLALLRATRAQRPEAFAAAADARPRRPWSGADGRLMVIAADHPARGAIGVGDDPGAMADRNDLLARLVTALARPGVDGALATADILDDLLLLGALDDKVVIGSMNRGGLRGAAFELDDRFTAYDAATIARMGFDGGKMLCRIDPSEPGSLRTLTACAAAVGELADHGLIALLEPFMSTRTSAGVRNDLSTAAVVQSVAIAAGLGAPSIRTWLKLPVVDDMARVMAATTLPTLLLGGDPSGAPDDTFARWERALALPGVHGLVVGRALLYPPDDDVAAAVDTAVALVHPDSQGQEHV